LIIDELPEQYAVMWHYSKKSYNLGCKYLTYMVRLYTNWQKHVNTQQ